MARGATWVRTGGSREKYLGVWVQKLAFSDFLVMKHVCHELHFSKLIFFICKVRITTPSPEL